MEDNQTGAEKREERKQKVIAAENARGGQPVTNPQPTWGSEKSSLDQSTTPAQKVSSAPVKLAPVLKKAPTPRKETFGQKLAKAFVNGSDRSIKDFMLYDILIPGIKNTLFGAVDGMMNAGRDGLSMAMFGDRRRSQYLGRYGGTSYVHYDTPSYTAGGYQAGYGLGGGYRGQPGYPYGGPQYQAPGSAPIGARPTMPHAAGPRPSARFDINMIPFESRADADIVLDGMAQCVAQYGLVTVANVAELVGIEWTAVDSQYGWRGLMEATVVQDRGDWMIRIPPPQFL